MCIRDRNRPIPHGTALNQLEAVLIAAAEPRLNLQRGRFGEAIQQFLQVDAEQ